MNFRFSPSARLAEESHTSEKVSLVRDISLTLNMTEYFSHSVLQIRNLLVLISYSLNHSKKYSNKIGNNQK